MQGFNKITKPLQTPFFIATVEDNNDPTFNYRVKVRIPDIHDSISTGDLPWAAKLDSSFCGMSDDGALNHCVPNIGSKVLILAVGDDLNSLIYLGSLYKKTSLTPTGDAYTGSYGIYNSGGQFIGVDKINKFFQLLYSGDVNLDLIENMTMNVSNAVTIICQNATVKASGNVTLDTPTTNVTGDLNVTGLISCDKDVKAKGEVSANSGAVNLSTHTHTGNLGAPTSPGQG